MEIKRAYYNGSVQTGSTISTIAYDGTHRRIEKSVTNSADLNGTYEYYYKGQSIIEMRDANDDVLKQYVWGQNYIDELVQIGINANPGSDDDGGTAATQDYCDDFYYTMHDANFNVLGVVDDEGTLVERYEYTPYGERTVFISAGSNDPDCSAPTLISQRIEISGTKQPYGLCEPGHQGLFHDEESGIINNRARMLHPTLGRFLQRDSLGYPDGLNAYAAYYILHYAFDPFGLDLTLNPMEFRYRDAIDVVAEYIRIKAHGGEMHLGQTIANFGKGGMRGTVVNYKKGEPQQTCKGWKATVTWTRHFEGTIDPWATVLTIDQKQMWQVANKTKFVIASVLLSLDTIREEMMHAYAMLRTFVDYDIRGVGKGDTKDEAVHNAWLDGEKKDIDHFNHIRAQDDFWGDEGPLEKYVNDPLGSLELGMLEDAYKHAP